VVAIDTNPNTTKSDFHLTTSLPIDKKLTLSQTKNYLLTVSFFEGDKTTLARN